MEKSATASSGCGSTGREHIENIKMLDGTEVTAIADPDSNSRIAALELLPGQSRAFESYVELLAADVCDALVIATPNFTHINVLRDSLQTDTHILIEKPLCTRVEDCLELVQRANGRKAIVWVAQEYRYMPPVAEMLRMTHAGAVGRVHPVAIREPREPFNPK